MLSAQNTKLRGIIDESVKLNEEQAAWYNNKWLWFGIGAAAGVTLSNAAR